MTKDPEVRPARRTWWTLRPTSTVLTGHRPGAARPTAKVRQRLRDADGSPGGSGRGRKEPPGAPGGSPALRPLIWDPGLPRVEVFLLFKLLSLPESAEVGWPTLEIQIKREVARDAGRGGVGWGAVNQERVQARAEDRAQQNGACT